MRHSRGILWLLSALVWGMVAGAEPTAPPTEPVPWTGLGGITAYQDDGTPAVCPHSADVSSLQIRTVDEGSPAAVAGVAAGEWLLAVDGVPVGAEVETRRALLAAVPGTPLKLTLSRAGGPVDVTVTPEARPLGDVARARLESATLWLCSQQRRNGGWNNPGPRGEIKPATQVAALALYALASAPDTGAGEKYANTIRAARDRATEFVLSYQAPDGGVDQKEAPRYRVFSSGFTLLALLKLDPVRNRERILKLRDFLLRAQVTPRPELPADHPALGGWNYYEEFQLDHLKVEVTVSAWAVDALAVARSLDEGGTAETFSLAEKFLTGCWNSPTTRPGAGDWADGGYLTNPQNSKAGEREIDLDVFQYRSYGSATADALRGLLRLGIAADDPRVVSARDWLARHFSVRRNPGFSEHAPVAYDHGIYYYWLLSLARALDLSGIERLPAGTGAPARDWRREIVLEMLARQDPKGYWKNPVPLMSEEEPVIATALGILALHHASRTLP